MKVFTIAVQILSSMFPLLIRIVFALSLKNTNGDFALCGKRSSVVLSLTQISLTKCIEECIARPSCLTINYRRNFPVCELLEDSNSIVRLYGCIGILKSQIIFETGALCDCNHGQKCNMDYGACTNSECAPVRSLQNGHVVGNLFTIGSVLNMVCDKDDSTYFLTCLSIGYWDNYIACDNTVCPGGWIQFLASCYYISTAEDGNKTASIAKSYCEGLGAHLARIDTKDKSNFITTKLSKTYPIYSFTNFWIGLEKVNHLWVWMDNGQVMNFTNWGLHQPSSIFNKVYVYIKTSDEYRWHDTLFVWRNGWICEKPSD